MDAHAQVFSPSEKVVPSSSSFLDSELPPSAPPSTDSSLTYRPRRSILGPKPLASSSAPPTTTPITYDWTTATKPTSPYPRNVYALQELCAQKDEHIRTLKAVLAAQVSANSNASTFEQSPMLSQQTAAKHSMIEAPERNPDMARHAGDDTNAHSVSDGSCITVHAQMLDTSYYGQGYISCPAADVPTFDNFKHWVRESTGVEAGDVWIASVHSDEGDGAVKIDGASGYRAHIDQCVSVNDACWLYIEEAAGSSDTGES